MGLEDSLPSEGRRGRPASEGRRRCRRRRRRPRGPTRGGELPGETRLFCCDPRRADQRGGRERSRVEIRKPPPKGRGASLDRLARAGAALVMSQVDSEPRGGLARRSPAEMLLAALGGDARALMDAFGVELLEPAELDLTPGCVERARADRGEAPLAE